MITAGRSMLRPYTVTHRGVQKGEALLRFLLFHQYWGIKGG